MVAILMLSPEILAGTRVTLGRGSWLLQLPLLVHVAAGITGLLTGFLALSLVKGGEGHRRIGRVFVTAMIVMGAVGAAIAAYEHKLGSVAGGFLSAYFVVTAMLTVRPWTAESRRLLIAATVTAALGGLYTLGGGIALAAKGLSVYDGVPVPAMFIFGTITVLAALSDVGVIRRGGLTGTPRLVRHIWRMCYALFIASGSFFLGQAQVFPKPYRIFPLLAIPAFAPIVIMLYWIWRVRLRRSLRGLVLRTREGHAAQAA